MKIRLKKTNTKPKLRNRFYASLAMFSLCASTSLFAQNPIICDQFTADPTARVFNGRLYLFPSHDIISPVEPERRWFSMADYHMFSSTDLIDWTDHGVILSQEQVPWGDPKAYSMWAPDCVEKDGKYYFFFPDAPADGKGFRIGVAIANSLFQAKFTPEKHYIEGISGIDPCVLQASNGKSYIFWGGGGLRVAELKDNLLELADSEMQNPTTLPNGMKFYGHAVKGIPEGFVEGPFAFERNGKYYLTFPWVRGKKGEKNAKGEIDDNPTETLAYCMSDDPMGPYEFKGVIMEESPTHCWTNHHSIVEFKGQWYLFYHHNDYSPSFDKNRSVCIDSLSFNADGTIKPVVPTRRGVGIVDARRQIQLDRYSAIGGGASIEYHDTLNCFDGWKTILPAKGWVSFNNVDTKSSSAQNVSLRIKSNKASVLRLELKNGYTTEMNIPSTNGKWQIIDLKVKVMPEGVTNVKLSNISKTQVEVDWISLTEVPRKKYFSPITSATTDPDAEGFIHRWMLLEPIDKPNRSNAVFTDSYLREHLTKEYFKGQFSTFPKDEEVVVVENQSLQWHALESMDFNVKLFRFSTEFQKKEYGVLFNAVTIIESPEDVDNVRLAVGSNSASMWWLNGSEALLLSGDRRMVKDDCVSPRLKLKKGRNILRGVVINGPGMSDFCVRFINENGEPLKNYKITLK